MKSKRNTAHLLVICILIKQKVMRRKKKSLKLFLKPTKSYQMQKSVLNTMKHVLCLKEVAFAPHKAVDFKAETFMMFLGVETHKIFSPIYLVAVDVAARAKDKTFKLKQQLHFVNLSLEQHLICAWQQIVVKHKISLLGFQRASMMEQRYELKVKVRKVKQVLAISSFNYM